METFQQFVRSVGFSRQVARQAALARKPSSRAGYQAKWLVYRRWCTTEGHSISRPSLPKIADFLFWLRRSRKLKSSIFEPLRQASLRDLTRKTLFLVALASAKRVSELQALSRTGVFFLGCCSGLCTRISGKDGFCFAVPSAAVASSYRSVCNLVKSPLHTLFFSLPRSQFLRNRFASPTVGWVAGVCLSSLCADSSGCQEAPLVLWGVNDDHSALLAPEAVASGALGDGGGRSSGSASGQRSVESTSFSSAASGSVKASSSCVETFQQFVRSVGS